MRATVDSLKLWDRIVDVPFFAYPPDRSLDKVSRVYAQFDAAGEALSLTRPNAAAGVAFQAFPAASWTPQAPPADVPLYEYRDAQSGARFYSVDAKLDSAGFTRTEKPICRVWKNPSSMVLLDYKATPVPYVRK